MQRTARSTRKSITLLVLGATLATSGGAAAGGAQAVRAKRAKSKVSIPLRKEEPVPTPAKPSVTV